MSRLLALRDLVILRRRLGRREPPAVREIAAGGRFDLIRSGDKFDVAKYRVERAGRPILYPAQPGVHYEANP